MWPAWRQDHAMAVYVSFINHSAVPTTLRPFMIIYLSNTLNIIDY